MQYQLKALPAAWLDPTSVIVEDESGDRYLLHLDRGDLERLDDRDVVLLMQWYEQVEAGAWYALPEARGEDENARGDTGSAAGLQAMPQAAQSMLPRRSGRATSGVSVDHGLYPASVG